MLREHATTTMSDVIRRATVDTEFRQTLLSDPKAILADYGFGDGLADVEIQVMEESRHKIILVLPSTEDLAPTTAAIDADAIAGIDNRTGCLAHTCSVC